MDNDEIRKIIGHILNHCPAPNTTESEDRQARDLYSKSVKEELHRRLDKMDFSLCDNCYLYEGEYNRGNNDICSVCPVHQARILADVLEFFVKRLTTSPSA